MQWAMVGWSHHRTPVEVRERLAFSKEQIAEAIRLFSAQYPRLEPVILSTCNRVELYCAADSPELMPSASELAKFLTDYHRFPFVDVEHQLTSLIDADAIRHLFTVAASLDSMVVGEAQILSQVKTAYEFACQGPSAMALMHQAFQRAIVVARRVTNETEIHRRRISIPSVAVSEIASEFFEKFDDKQILLIGAGEMGTETLRYLVEAGASRITVVNRNTSRAQELAAPFQATVAPWNQLYNQLFEADLVVSTTGATEPIVTADAFREARGKKVSRAVLILDLAVPRDFESSIAQLSDVYLYSLDDLQTVCDRNIQARKQQWPKAQQIVNQETIKFFAESTHRGSGSTIKQFRDQANQIKQEELEKLIPKLELHGLNSQSKKEVEKAFDRLVNKLLHPPLQSLRENADSSQHATLIDALRRLFQLKD
jgi:glutamyl-tRNA reductase